MHLLLLVWKTSGYYNTSQRLVVCIRELCNSILRQAKAYLDGEMIFELVEQNRLKDIIDMLQHTLRVIGSFKTVYFDYKVCDVDLKSIVSGKSVSVRVHHGGLGLYKQKKYIINLLILR